MSVASKFDWSAINDSQFEELVLALVQSKFPVRAEFRKGPADKGRDIQAWFRNKDAIGLESEELYFFEAKHHMAGVSPDHISGALSWAQAEQPNTLVFVISSHLTNPCRDNIAAWQKNNARVKVAIWERNNIENQILSSTVLQDTAIKLGLLPPSIKGLLPPHPERYRPSNDEMGSGLEMEFRYWLAEEDIDKLETVAGFIESCGKIFDENDLRQKYFEMACLGIPNWSTWLRLLRAECLLQLAVRDYLFAQVSNATVEELKSLARRVAKQVALVDEIGAKSGHVD